LEKHFNEEIHEMGVSRRSPDTEFRSPPSFVSPFGEFRFDPGRRAFLFVPGAELAESLADEARRRNLLRQILSQLGVTAPVREQQRRRFERAFYDRLREKIMEEFALAQSEALEQLATRNLLGSSLEARRLGSLDLARMRSLTEAARRAILESEALRHQDEEMKLAILRALEEGIAGEFARRLQAAGLVTDVGLRGTRLSQRAQEFYNQLMFNIWRERLRPARRLLALGSALNRFGPAALSFLKGSVPLGFRI
jgi:hypothetical protein